MDAAEAGPELCNTTTVNHRFSGLFLFRYVVFFLFSKHIYEYMYIYFFLMFVYLSLFLKTYFVEADAEPGPEPGVPNVRMYVCIHIYMYV